MDKLFVYGTLAPGKPNAHILEAIGGNWEVGTVVGRLQNKGWGSEQGFPGINLDINGLEIQGLIFSSENLSSHWAKLDEFEGEGYERVITYAKMEDGSMVETFIYKLR